MVEVQGTVTLFNAGHGERRGVCAAANQGLESTLEGFLKQEQANVEQL